MDTPAPPGPVEMAAAFREALKGNTLIVGRGQFLHKLHPCEKCGDFCSVCQQKGKCCLEDVTK